MEELEKDELYLTYEVEVESNGEKGVLVFHTGQPTFERTELCLPIFRYFARKTKELTIQTLGVDLNSYINKIQKSEAEDYPNLAEDFELWCKECMQNSNVFSKDNPKEVSNGLKIFKNLKEKDKKQVKAYLVFIYALLRYVPQFLKMKESSELLTALSFGEFKKLFSQSLGATEENCLNEKKQKG